METIFEWDDSAERSGLNKIRLSLTPDGSTAFHVAHAGTATVVVLPDYAVENMVNALRPNHVHDGRSMEIHHADEWSALYVDGTLAEVGDTYWVEEKAFAMLGVAEVSEDSFLRGQGQKDGVAKTLEEVAEYRRSREERLQEAANLREAAASLLAQASEMEQR